MKKVFYRRHLPHWQPEGAALFVTWRLDGSLPQSKRSLPRTTGKDFVEFDRLLDRGDYGPLWLNHPRIAQIVADAFRYGQETLRLYDLDSWVILANHVHLLIQPKVEISRITQLLKSYTARSANRLLNRSGRPFWQDESFDHWVRHQPERAKIIRYIESNPVKAGLVTKPEDWPWSSAYIGQK